MIHDEVRQLLAEAEAAAPEDVTLAEGASEEEIAGFEERTGLRVPAELREWWRLHNGSPFGDGGFYSIATAEGDYDWHPLWRERGWIPVGGDGCGDTYVLDSRPASGPRGIYFIEHESDQSRLEYVVASDLWQFLRFNLVDEQRHREWDQACDALDEAEGEDAEIEYPEEPDSLWPFNQEYVVAQDPEIVNCTSGPLPWHADHYWASNGG